jgi:hypothetical protein
MPDLTLDDPIAAQQRPAGPASGLDSDSASCARTGQNFLAWAAIPSPMEDDTSNETGQPTTEENPSSAAPTQETLPDQNGDLNDPTRAPLPTAQSVPDELRFDDLIPKTPPTMYWPGLGRVSLAPPPGTTPDIYRTDLLERFNPITLLSQLTALRQNPPVPTNPTFHRPQTADPSLDDATPQPPRSGTRYAADVRNNAITNDAVIDRNTDFLLDVLAESVHAMGEGAGPLFGIRVHADFGARVKGYDLPGIGAKGVEQSFHLGEAVRYGAEGSIRTDIILRDVFGKPIAIYDLKTGNAKLTASRIGELREGARAPNVPVIELRFQAGTAVLR